MTSNVANTERTAEDLHNDLMRLCEPSSGNSPLAIVLLGTIALQKELLDAYNASPVHSMDAKIMMTKRCYNSMKGIAAIIGGAR